MINIKEKYYKIIAFSIGVVLSVLILFQSGHFITSVSRTINISSIIILFFLVLAFYCLTLDFKKIGHDIKNKKIPKPSFSFVAFVFVEFMLILSLIFNKNKADNVASYINYALLFAVSVLFVKTFKFKTFVKWYSNVLTIVCIISIVFYVVVKITGFSFTSISHIYSTSIYSDYFLLYSDYSVNEAQGVFYNGANRLQGLFWEPGVFGTIICIGLLLEVGFKEKRNYFKIILFLVTLFLTKSTGAWIVLPLVLLYGIFDYLERRNDFSNKKRTITYLVVIFVSIALIGLALLIFKDKFFNRSDSGSFFTRFYSSAYNLKIWVKSPIFGFGFKTAREMYNELAPSAITANTATPSLLLSSFGIVGVLYTVLPVLGLALNNKFSSAKAVVLFIIFILVLHQENNASLIAPSIFYAYLALGSIKFKWEKVEGAYSWKRSNVIINVIPAPINSECAKPDPTNESNKKRKYKSLYPVLSIVTTLALLTTMFASVNLIGFYKEKDDLFNISQVLTQKKTQKYDGAIAELHGNISTSDWLSYYSLTSERTNNKGMVFSIGDTIINNEYKVSYSEISISNKSSIFNSRSLSFLNFDRSLFGDDSIILPRNLTDKIYGARADYSDILGKEVTIRISDSAIANKKIIGVYENHSNFEKFSNNIFVKNFDYVVFLPDSEILNVNSISNRRYFLTLSSTYQSNYSLYYSSFDFGVKTLSFPDLNMNNDFYDELSLNQYIDYSHQAIAFKTHIKVIAIVISLVSLLVLIYCFYNDFVNKRYKHLPFACFATFAVLGLISLIVFNKTVLFKSTYFVSIVSNGWVWIVSLSLSLCLIIATYKYIPLVEQAIKKWLIGLIVKWKEKKKR